MWKWKFWLEILCLPASFGKTEEARPNLEGNPWRRQEKLRPSASPISLNLLLNGPCKGDTRKHAQLINGIFCSNFSSFNQFPTMIKWLQEDQILSKPHCNPILYCRYGIQHFTRRSKQKLPKIRGSERFEHFSGRQSVRVLMQSAILGRKMRVMSCWKLTSDSHSQVGTEKNTSIFLRRQKTWNSSFLQWNSSKFCFMGAKNCQGQMERPSLPIDQSQCREVCTQTFIGEILPTLKVTFAEEFIGSTFFSSAGTLTVCQRGCCGWAIGDPGMASIIILGKYSTLSLS